MFFFPFFLLFFFSFFLSLPNSLSFWSLFFFHHLFLCGDLKMSNNNQSLSSSTIKKKNHNWQSYL
jgi:hypothetical protein